MLSPFYFIIIQFIINNMHRLQLKKYYTKERIIEQNKKYFV
ncbi:hypothetical protein BACPLE_03339 [Phocaeicola plebeius DSM 17135]|uniref:Uncharacterized protein n=1 Tax=Phocaeicola plebeius (strain DSM 17135 / JCM 12973 / CCUG 54634 / M2) TaxID=484018 RepID=B5D2U9_PHOPM|nr:hypothetical protein BACPLE_03339 [Phocaeicola plebeius DSM 17135]